MRVCIQPCAPLWPLSCWNKGGGGFDSVQVLSLTATAAKHDEFHSGECLQYVHMQGASTSVSY